MRPLLDPRLHSATANLWPSRVTITQVTFTTTAANQKVPSASTPVPGLVNLPCRMAPEILLRPTDTEQLLHDIQEAETTRHLKINKFCPQIVPRQMMAVVDGKPYPIKGIETDGNNWSTRLRLEVIKP